MQDVKMLNILLEATMTASGTESTCPSQGLAQVLTQNISVDKKNWKHNNGVRRPLERLETQSFL